MLEYNRVVISCNRPPLRVEPDLTDLAPQQLGERAFPYISFSSRLP
jgi:hypothetical protein